MYIFDEDFGKSNISGAPISSCSIEAVRMQAGKRGQALDSLYMGPNANRQLFVLLNLVRRGLCNSTLLQRRR